jgi:tryptophanyl-tRNA synthetase
VPEHIELAYYFSTVTTIAKMSHLPTFKEKVKQYPEHNTMALLNYPVLMASDILVYKAGLVPVGVDQEPHIEVAREIARRMNADFGLDFPEPQRFATKGEYVPSLSGEGKMSKSVEGSYIALTDDLETIKRKIAKIPTDSGTGKISIFKNDPISLEDVVRYEYIHDGVQQGVAALMTLVELFMGQQKRKDCDKLYETSGIKYSDLKRELSEAIYLELKPIQERHAEITDEYLNEVIRDGARRAREVATVTVKEVKEKMGLLV